MLFIPRVDCKSLLLPHAHAQGIVLSICPFVSTKSTRSQDLDFKVCYKRDRSSEKLASGGFNCTNATYHAFLVATPIAHTHSADHVLSAHAHKMVSKGR